MATPNHRPSEIDYVTAIRHESFDKLLGVAKREDLEETLDNLESRYGKGYVDSLLRGRSREEAIERLWELTFHDDPALSTREELTPFVPAECSELVSNTPCASALLYNLNAWTIKDPGGGIGILMANELITMFWDFNVCAISSLHAIDHLNKEDTLGCLRDCAAYLTSRIAQVFLGNRFEGKMTYQFPSDAYYKVVNGWERIQFGFVFAHEMGHVVLAHLDDKELGERTIPGISEPTSCFLTSRDQELAADEFGWALVCTPAEVMDESAGMFFQSRDARSLAIDVQFTCFDLIEFVRDYLLGQPSLGPLSSTHPPSKDRRERFREMTGFKNSTLFSTAKDVERITEHYKSLYESPENLQGFREYFGVAEKSEM